MKDTVTSRDWRGPEIQKTIAPMGQAGGAVLLAALYIVVLPEVLAAAEEAAVAAAAAAGVREAAEPEERVRSGLAAAIAAAADDEVIADVIALARDARHGSSRLLLLSALERSADPRARAALIELGADPDLTKEVHVSCGASRVDGRGDALRGRCLRRCRLSPPLRRAFGAERPRDGSKARVLRSLWSPTG
jgi:hypothetical protein